MLNVECSAFLFVQLTRQPLHLRPIRRRFLGYDNVNLFGIAKNGFKPANHPVGTADDLRRGWSRLRFASSRRGMEDGGWTCRLLALDSRLSTLDCNVSCVQQRRQPDAAGNG